MKALIKKSTREWVNIAAEPYELSRFHITKKPDLYDTETIEILSGYYDHLDFTDIDLVEVVVIRKDMVPSDEEISEDCYPGGVGTPDHRLYSKGRIKGAKWMRDKLLGQHTDNQEGKG